MQTNFLIIGSGIAGLNLALKLAKKGAVLLITKTTIQESNSYYAQGGIAAVLQPYDSFEKHIEDTMIAGHHTNDPIAVETLAKNAPSVIAELQALGVPFASEQGREGGHSENRISHVGDYTGRSIVEALTKAVQATPNITILENCFALELLTRAEQCFGVWAVHNGQPLQILAGQTILATGGLGQAFAKTTNPQIATGDGIAMALRSGVKLQDLKYIQFHPTALDVDTKPLFLISEAVRGEGARLINEKGEYFMAKLHPQKDLAPRDIVTAAIQDQQAAGHKISLDCRKFKGEFLQQRFPDIYTKLASLGITMEKDLIPVTPAAHYSCGGIAVNLHGETNIKNLLACGEVARTGVHGQNRLASNSLLEALVFGNLLAENIQPTTPVETFDDTPVPTKSRIEAERENIRMIREQITENRE